MTKAEQMIKICSQCKECKELSDFAIDRQKKGGHRPDCRECRSAFYQANVDRVKRSVALYQEKNRVAIAEKKRSTYAKNRDLYLEKKRVYTAANKEVLRLRGLAWRQANPETVKAMSALYRIKAAAQIRVRNLNRIAKSKAAPGEMSKGIVARLMRLQRGRCACCRERLGSSFHLDHILPLALGGGNDDANLQLLKPRCNLIKSAKHPVDFMRSRGFLL